MSHEILVSSQLAESAKPRAPRHEALPGRHVTHEAKSNPPKRHPLKIAFYDSDKDQPTLSSSRLPIPRHGERKRRPRRSVSLPLSSLCPVQSTNIRCSYVPRKCSATNRIIKAKDHASVQISVGKVDENGRYTGENQVYALCGFVRAMGEGDDSLNRLAQRDGMLKGVWSGQKMR